MSAPGLQAPGSRVRAGKRAYEHVPAVMHSCVCVCVCVCVEGVGGEGEGVLVRVRVRVCVIRARVC